MATCPVCGRQYGDDVTACPADGTPLEADGAAAEHDEREPETVVRPRSAQPIPSPRFTEIKLERQAPRAGGEAVSLPRRPEVVAVPAAERSLWPAVAAIAVVIALGLGGFFYYVTVQQTEFSREVGAQISEARVTVADARARLESLPPASPLRGKLLQLQQWDRELQNMELGRDRTSDMSARAREITAQARSVGEEARAAGAVVPATPPQVPPATPQPNAPAPGQTVETPADPMKGASPTTPSQPETKPAEPHAEPPPPATNTAAPPGAVNPAPTPGTQPPGTKPGSETKKAPPQVDEPPPPPPPKPDGRP